MVQAGRELWSSSSSTSLLKKDPLEPSLRVVPTGLGISSRKETPKPPWAPVPLLSHLTTKKFFLVFRWNFVFHKHTSSIPSIWGGEGHHNTWDRAKRMSVPPNSYMLLYQRKPRAGLSKEF